ncbi:hypothetical protein AJ87_41735 [Rhizobium yanglingense]|nr:hypothetical protein AJ87_41735 [Rhizobium yanglingense]
MLIEHFNRKLAERKGGAPLRFSSRVLDALLAYRWPGNVRELRNLVERLHLLSFNGFVDIHDLPGDMLEPSQGPAAIPLTTNLALDAQPPVFSFEDAERLAIKNALVAEHGNLSKVAQRLGVSRPTLYRKLEQFGIKRSFV